MQCKRVWIDIVTDPDVLFVRPLVDSLTLKGHEVIVTSRTNGNLRSLSNTYGLNALFVDSFYGHSTMSKTVSTLCRAYQLMVWAYGNSFDVAFSFCSRAQAIASAGLRIPCATTYDYEHVESRTVNTLCSTLILPELVPLESYLTQGATRDKIVRYSGLKEEVYATDLTPDDTLYKRLGIDSSRVIVTVRTSSVHTHYANHNTEPLDKALVPWLLNRDNTSVIVLPRYDDELRRYQQMARHDPHLVVVTRPENGQNLIWHSDLVISGGGSMIREAVVLGVPAYDMFGGRAGIIESDLIEHGQVTKLVTADDFNKISLRKRGVGACPPKDGRLREFFVEHILKTATQ